MSEICESCGVEDSSRERVCTHGHPLGAPASTGSLSVLRSQVDQAFEEARVQIDRMMAPVPPAGARVGVAPPPPPPPPSQMRTQPPAPSQARRQPPPPRPGQANTYASLQNTAQVASDPIQAFAPAPIMDWGPSKWGRFRRPAS